MDKNPSLSDLPFGGGGLSLKRFNNPSPHPERWMRMKHNEASLKPKGTWRKHSTLCHDQIWSHPSLYLWKKHLMTGVLCFLSTVACMNQMHPKCIYIYIQILYHVKIKKIICECKHITHASWILTARLVSLNLSAIQLSGCPWRINRGHRSRAAAWRWGQWGRWGNPQSTHWGYLQNLVHRFEYRISCFTPSGFQIHDIPC